MKENSSSIIFYGRDIEFFNELTQLTTSQNNKCLKVKQLDYQEVPLSLLLSKSSVSIIFIDFTDPKLDQLKIRGEIRQIKRSQYLKSIMFIGLFATAKECQDNKMALVEGISFILVKGDEEKLVIEEVFSLLYSQVKLKQRFSKARNLKLPLQISSMGCIDKISTESMSIETDVSWGDNGNEEKLALNIELFDYKGEEKYTITHYFQGACHYPLFHYYTLEYPYPEVWEVDSERFLQKDSVETWLDHNNDRLHTSRNTIVFSKSSSFLLNQTNCQLENIKCYVFDSVSEHESFADILAGVCPKVLFFEIDDTIFTYEVFQVLINELVKFDDSCIVVALNTPSSSAALRKMFKYDSIIATSGLLEVPLYKDFVSRLSQSEVKGEQENFEFLTNDKMKLVLVESKVILLSLTEHEIEFSSSIYFPLYTALSIDLPVKALLTITEKTKVNEKYQYVGVLHGIDSHQRELLRRLVNQFIFKVPKELTYEIIKSLLAHVKNPKATLQQAQDENIIKDKVTNDSTGEEEYKYIKTTYSKL
jgi:hypothetical protein